jgi:hypothetical protein
MQLPDVSGSVIAAPMQLPDALESRFGRLMHHPDVLETLQLPSDAAS